MPQPSLKKLFTRNKPFFQVITKLAASIGPDIGVQDAKGNNLLGPPGIASGERFPIQFSGETQGWVFGESASESLAQLIAYLLEQEAEKKALANEVLERYRELNLLFNLSEHLATSPQPEAIAEVAFEQATRLIKATDGMLMAMDERGGEAQIASLCASNSILHLEPGSQDKLIAKVLSAGKGEIYNDVPASDFFVGGDNRRVSLLCSPLRTEKRVLGAILLISEPPVYYTAEDLRLLNTIALQAAPALEVARLYQSAVEKGRMERELQMARQVQEGLLPESVPVVPGWSFAVQWQPALEVAGDYYDFIAQPDGCIGVVIADVTDKGMPASLFMVYARSALRAWVDRTETPAEAITSANHLICQESFQRMFVTLFYAHLDPFTGRVEYVNAGHNPPLHFVKEEECLVRLMSTGLPLGIDLDDVYEQRLTSIAPGEFILFYTDGVTEAMNADRQLFGMKRLESVVFEHRHDSPQELIAAVLDAVNEFTGSLPLHDDTTLLVVKRL